MYIKRTSKRKDSVSSEDNDYEESYANIQFQVDFPTKPNQTLYILGNIEELGNWRKDEAVKLIKLDENTSIWESTETLECPVGMTIKYKYLVSDSKNNKIFEDLPNDSERSITTKKPGQYVIINKKCYRGGLVLEKELNNAFGLKISSFMYQKSFSSIPK